MGTENAATPITGVCEFYNEGYGITFWAFQDSRFIKIGESGEEWGPEGLHALKNGDHLTIFSKDNPEHEVWSGHIKLPKEMLVPDSSTLSGMGLAPQEGVEHATWKRWFNQNYPAKLVPAPNAPA